MPYYKLLVFKMGKHKEECIECSPKCQFRYGDKCRLYSCHECKEFLEEGTDTVRVSFQATLKMEARKRYLGGRSPKQATAFVSFHVDCYKRQLDRWIANQLEKQSTR